ncbi:MAG: M4 family metallopeptidase [Gammaproteobacteria bacterium]
MPWAEPTSVSRSSINGIPVWPAELIVHLDPQGDVDVLNGSFVPTPSDVLAMPVVADADAVTTARRHVGASATAKTQSVLIFYGPGDQPTRLAWKVEVEKSLVERWLVIVDALDGSVITASNQVAHENVQGPGIDTLGVTRPLNVWHHSVPNNGHYDMVDTSKSMFDPTSDPLQPSTKRGVIFVFDLFNQPPAPSLSSRFITSNNPNGGWLPDGVAAAFNLSKSYDYYLQRHGRDSFDNQKSNLIAFVRLKDDNATSGDGQLIFGSVRPYAASLDVVGHEFTHGVTQTTAGLLGQLQPGALNEAFSDIFGEMVEVFTTGATDWLAGSQIDIHRSLNNPGSISVSYPDCNVINRPYPARMSEFVVTECDDGGEHLNSTIISHAYYLLAQGLNGALGLSDAERIFYRALTTYLTSNSQFLDSRFAAIQAAKDLFGADSMQVGKVAEAFDSVEICPTNDNCISKVWYDPSQNGQGLQILQQGNTLSGAWFLYDSNGAGMWVTFAGAPLVNQTATVDLLRFTGPALGAPWNNALVQSASVGSGTLNFTTAAQASFDYTLLGASGHLDLASFDAAAIDPFSGVWFDQGRNGQGLQLVHNGDRLSGAWYLYDQSGAGMWLSFVGNLATDNTMTAPLLRFTGPPLGTPWNSALVQNSVAGKVSLRFASASAATLNATVSAVPVSLNLIPFGR